METLNSEYWGARYATGETGWDIGFPSPPITEYLDSIKDQSLTILIPGCGNSYEGEYAWETGFENIILLDYAIESKENFLNRVPDFPEEQFIVGDFFDLEGSFDLILEQTFFCALDPSLRRDYAQQMYDLLNPGGRLAGVLFEDKLYSEHPPFGGSTLEYLGYFQPVFDKVSIKPCYNSIEPRLGREVFIKMDKA